MAPKLDIDTLMGMLPYQRKRGKWKSLQLNWKKEWERFDAKKLLRKVDARIANAVLGDMRAVTTYGGYKKISGINFPTRMTLSYGDHPTLKVSFDDVKFNVPADIKPPKGLKPRGNRVKADKVADGIWHLTGGSHHSVAIEMADHVIIYEAPLSEARGAAVFAATRKVIPGKPIRYVINSHHHFDHSGGLRALAAEGAAIVSSTITGKLTWYFDSATPSGSAPG